MHAHPDPLLLVRENINIMISTAHGAELLSRDRLQITDRFELPRRIVEQFVLDARFAFAPDPERNFAHHVVHDLVDLRRSLLQPGVRYDSEIAAGDVKTDAAQ